MGNENQTPGSSLNSTLRAAFRVAAIVSLALLAGCRSRPDRVASEQELRLRMKTNFSPWPGAEAAWYPHIKDLRIEASAAIAATDLEMVEDNARGICAGISSLVFPVNRYGVREVRVLSAARQPLVSRASLTASCR